MTRTFSILVRDRKGRVLRYTNLTGKKTEACMKHLQDRGFNPIAETTANGITETLTHDELKQAIL